MERFGFAYPLVMHICFSFFSSMDECPNLSRCQSRSKIPKIRPVKGVGVGVVSNAPPHTI